jgi:TolB-like protein/Tfp pilus assembly protein PilF
MFTDIVGYTYLTQRDEALAMKLLETHRELIRPILSKHAGREVKTIGDAFLVEFGSALEATECGVEIQKILHEYDQTASERIWVRVGIHLGDVIHKDGDVYGDAVNIASRIEPLASAGGICITGQVYDQVRNKIPYQMIKLRPRGLKNVAVPIDAYKLELPWEKERLSGVAEGNRVAVLPLERLSGVAEGNRVAVLPFANISPDPTDEYFADGMTEELISTISNISELSVISRTSVMSYKGTNKKMREIGQELEVSSVLEGSVRKAGNRMRVTAQLINVGSDKHLWAQSYDMELSDVFAVQSEIAKRVAEALRIRILPSEEKQIEKRPTESPEAYALYLKGRYQWNKRSEEGARSAIEFFQKAIEIDPRYALAYSGIADSYVVLAADGRIPRTEALPKAKEYAIKALEIDDGLAEAHTSFASALECPDWDWVGSEREFRRAIEINPSYATAHQWYALLLEQLGRFDEAIQEILRAQELDPLSMAINVAVARVYDTAGQYDNAIEHGKRWVEMEPNSALAHVSLANSFSWKKMYADAVREAQAAAALRSEDWAYRVNLGILYGLSGNLQEAEKMLSEMLERSKTQYVSPMLFAAYYLVLGDETRMFERLQTVYEERDESLGLLRFDPDFVKYRQDPRYIDLIRKMKLEGSPFGEETIP